MNPSKAVPVEKPERSKKHISYTLTISVTPKSCAKKLLQVHFIQQEEVKVPNIVILCPQVLGIFSLLSPL